MTEQTAQTWVESTEEYLTEAEPELGARFAPQIKALRELAQALDTAGRYEATLAAEYARIHRWLLNKTAPRGVAAPAPDEGDDLLSMFLSNPGARWSPDA